MKHLSDFPIHRKKKDGRGNLCSACKKEYNKIYYQQNRERHNPARAERNRRYRAEVRGRMIAYLLTHPCVDCGETDILVLQFDHQGDKIDTIANMVANGLSWEKTILPEIAKCQVVCANDHARRTARQIGWHKLSVAPSASSEVEHRTLNPGVEISKFSRRTA
jgi:hypothetical protein